MGVPGGNLSQIAVVASRYCVAIQSSSNILKDLDDVSNGSYSIESSKTGSDKQSSFRQ